MICPNCLCLHGLYHCNNDYYCAGVVIGLEHQMYEFEEGQLLQICVTITGELGTTITVIFTSRDDTAHCELF